MSLFLFELLTIWYLFQKNEISHRYDHSLDRLGLKVKKIKKSKLQTLQLSPAFIIRKKDNNYVLCTCHPNPSQITKVNESQNFQKPLFYSMYNKTSITDSCGSCENCPQ